MIDDSFCIDEQSPDNRWVTVFEDDGETGTLYLCKCDELGDVEMMVDYLRLYSKIYPSIETCKDVFIIWSKDSKRTALVVNEECWGMLDLSSKRKLIAKRDKNSVMSISRHTWDNGIEVSQGESLCLDKEYLYKSLH